MADAIEQFGLHYPVVQDNNMGTWNAYGNEYWPADYLIDAHGDVRYATVGEGDYGKTETAIRALLAEAGAPGRRQEPPDRRGRALQEAATPETYLGTARAEGWVDGPGGRRCTTTGRATGTARAQRVRLQRHLEHRRPARRSGRGRGHRRASSRQSTSISC